MVKKEDEKQPKTEDVPENGEALYEGIQEVDPTVLNNEYEYGGGGGEEDDEADPD